MAPDSLTAADYESVLEAGRALAGRHFSGTTTLNGALEMWVVAPSQTPRHRRTAREPPVAVADNGDVIPGAAAHATSALTASARTRTDSSY